MVRQMAVPGACLSLRDGTDPSATGITADNSKSVSETK